MWGGSRREKAITMNFQERNEKRGHRLKKEFLIFQAPHPIRNYPRAGGKAFYSSFIIHHSSFALFAASGRRFYRRINCRFSLPFGGVKPLHGTMSPNPELKESIRLKKALPLTLHSRASRDHRSLFLCFQDVSIAVTKTSHVRALGMETPRRWKHFWKHLWKQDLMKTLVESPRMGIFMETPGDMMETLVETKWSTHYQ